jgi:endonuclease/exonuclease/phosphatase family metal-dependent hydrolase
MNDEKGPDILAIVEVESLRAAELLKDALNASLKDETLHYKNVVMKPISAGRHIAPAVITRLPVVRDRTRLLGKRQRILQTVVKVNDQDLVVIASHWTSRIEKSSEHRRDNYADAIFGAVRGMYENNDRVDVLICGDFNDTPDDESVTKHLRATGDREAVLGKPEDGPLLYNLMAGRNPREYGTHYYSGKWLIFDQIVVSPGMLDTQGWQVLPETLTTFKEGMTRPRDRAGRPWRFGSPNEDSPRGYSDHFPVTVRLKVSGR